MHPLFLARKRTILLQVAVLLVAFSHRLSHHSASAAFTNCGFTADLNFAVWGDHFETDLPTVFPPSEPALRDLLLSARRNNCRVRPVGATHSTAGIVAHKGDTNVVTVNLADLTVPGDWSFQLDAANLLVRAPAGASLFDLQAFIRPKGFLLPTSTASPLFALGGVFLSPSVHGNVVAEDRVTTLLMGVRAMLSNGTVIVERGEAAMHKWRGSLGFLGIATAVELRVRRDTGFKLVADSFRVRPWQRNNHIAMFRKRMKGFDGFQWFWNPFNNDVVGTKTDFDGDPSFDFGATTADYDRLRADFDGIQRKGLTNPNQLAADVGASLAPGRLVLGAAILAAKVGQRNVNDSPRDGYSYGLDGTFFNNQLEGHLRCPSDCIGDGFLFGLMDVTRRYVLNVNMLQNGMFPSVPVSIRLFTVARDDIFLLNYLAAGRYVAIEMTVPRAQDERDEPFAPFLRGVEREWNLFAWKASPSRAQFHIGKEWGFDMIAGLPQPYPFQSDVQAAAFFSDEQRREFLAIADSFDPDGLLRAGELARLLEVASNKFEPRRGNSEDSQGASTSCETFGDAECISGCCCQSFLWCSLRGVRNQCTSGTCQFSFGFGAREEV